MRKVKKVAYSKKSEILPPSISFRFRFRKVTANFVLSAHPLFCPTGIDRAHWTDMREKLYCGFQPNFIVQN